MRLSDYNYELPEALIANKPPAKRGDSRLLVLNRKSGETSHQKYPNLIDYLNPGDVIVLNNTKVIKARLLAKNQKGHKRELLLLEDHHNTDFTRRKIIYRGKISPGEKLRVNDTEINIDKIFSVGMAEISSSENLLTLSENFGNVPLPPYMRREATSEDVERYQTIFAKAPGSVAAPTASLNFTKELELKLRKKGIQIVYLTLHVGLGTFLPIRSENITDHEMHSEYFEIPSQTVEILQNTLSNRCNIVAIGTTVTRTLEFAAEQIMHGPAESLSGEANIFIYPGYEFKIVNAMLTNFHAPKSTVLMMAAAFAGWDNLKNAYQGAAQKKYSFLSYGDSMLIH